MNSPESSRENGVEKRITEDLSEHIENAHDYLARLPEAAILFRADGCVVGTNEQAGTLLGKVPSQLVSTLIENLFAVTGAVEFIERSFLPRDEVEPAYIDLLSIDADPDTNSVTNPDNVPYKSLDNRLEVRTILLPVEGGESLYLSLLSGASASEWREHASNLKKDSSEQEKLQGLRTRFVEMLSHEFRTPLTVIRSSSDLLLRYGKKLTDEQHDKYLQIIQEQVQVLSRFLHEALSVSEQGNPLQADKRTLNLELFIESLQRQCKDMPRERSSVRMILDWPKQTIEADEHLLRLALCNILSNSIRYSPTDKEVLFHVCDENGDLCVRITDSGRGIPASEISEVFEPFYRGTNVTDVNGVGLGLTLARDFIESHSGVLTIQSKEGEGTVVIVRIPQSA